MCMYVGEMTASSSVLTRSLELGKPCWRFTQSHWNLLYCECRIKCYGGIPVSESLFMDAWKWGSLHLERFGLFRARKEGDGHRLIDLSLWSYLTIYSDLSLTVTTVLLRMTSTGSVARNRGSPFTSLFGSRHENSGANRGGCHIDSIKPGESTWSTPGCCRTNVSKSNPFQSGPWGGHASCGLSHQALRNWESPPGISLENSVH